MGLLKGPRTKISVNGKKSDDRKNGTAPDVSQPLRNLKPGCMTHEPLKRMSGPLRPGQVVRFEVLLMIAYFSGLDLYIYIPISISISISKSISIFILQQDESL